MLSCVIFSLYFVVVPIHIDMKEKFAKGFFLRVSYYYSNTTAENKKDDVNVQLFFKIISVKQGSFGNHSNKAKKLMQVKKKKNPAKS